MLSPTPSPFLKCGISPPSPRGHTLVLFFFSVIFFFNIFETWAHVTQASLELSALLPQPQVGC